MYKFNLSKINIRIAVIAVILLISIFGSQVVITSLIGTKSTEVLNIRKEKDNVRLQNELLQSEINKLKAFTAAGDTTNLEQKDITFLEKPNLGDLAQK